MASQTEYTAGEPRTVDEARDAVERSRQRIASTLDALEDRIVEKKHELQQKADVLRPVREQVVQRPFTAVALAVGVGALLGTMGGSDADDAPRSRSGGRHRDGGYLSAAERKERREWRKQRHERWENRNRQREREEEDERRGPSSFDNLKNQLMGAVTTAIGAAVTAKVRDLTGTSNNGRKR